jgi:RHH-type transcriptional regulator, rel operon repressor / antitoxin RelB
VVTIHVLRVEIIFVPAIRLDADTEQRFDRLTKMTGRTKTFYAREAIVEHLEDLEDIYPATQRLRRPAKTCSARDVKRELGLYVRRTSFERTQEARQASLGTALQMLFPLERNFRAAGSNAKPIRQKGGSSPKRIFKPSACIYEPRRMMEAGKSPQNARSRRGLSFPRRLAVP